MLCHLLLPGALICDNLSLPKKNHDLEQSDFVPLGPGEGSALWGGRGNGCIRAEASMSERFTEGDSWATTRNPSRGFCHFALYRALPSLALFFFMHFHL